MSRTTNRSLALLALGALAWLPAGASADPGPHYSPWHYRTPIIYRWCEEHYYGLGPGSYRPDRFPAGAVNPNARPALPTSQSGSENQPGSEKAAPATESPEAAKPEAGS